MCTMSIVFQDSKDSSNASHCGSDHTVPLSSDICVEGSVIMVEMTVPVVRLAVRILSLTAPSQVKGH